MDLLQNKLLEKQVTRLPLNKEMIGMPQKSQI